MRSLATLCLLSLLLPTAALASSGDTIPGHPDVIGEYVQIPGAQAVGTPDALNTASYLRVRLLVDGDSPKPAHAVVIAQPGFASTPGVWIELAAQLVEKAAARDCGEKKDVSPCRIEFWIMDRRGSQIEDTAGLRIARSANSPFAALDYYFGVEVLGFPFPGSGRFPLVPPDALITFGFGDFVPLTTADVPFMSEWGFETMAADVDALINFLPTGADDGAKNIFLAGHSQGGGFVSLYAGRRLADGRRGHENLAGLIFLDGGPSAGFLAAPTMAAIDDHLDEVDDLRTGAEPVFGSSIGGLALSPGIGALSAVSGVFYDVTPSAESIFVPQAIANFGFFSPEFTYLLTLRHTYRANGGLNFDRNPVPCTTDPLQFPFLGFLGANLGELDETMTPCGAAPFPDFQLHDWIDGGGTQPPGGEPSKASGFTNSNGYGPSFTNVEPITVNFPSGRMETIDAGEMNGFTWYQSTRYDMDSGFLGAYQVVNFDEDGVSHDIDRTTIAAPVYVARQGGSANPFPLVSDFTNINRLGTTQSAAAAALSPIAAEINSSQYGHTDFMMADDSQAGVRTPGQAGASVTSNTLIDWLLERSEGRAPTPKPKKLGVVQTR